MFGGIRAIQDIVIAENCTKTRLKYHQSMKVKKNIQNPEKITSYMMQSVDWHRVGNDEYHSFIAN